MSLFLHFSQHIDLKLYWSTFPILVYRSKTLSHQLSAISYSVDTLLGTLQHRLMYYWCIDPGTRNKIYDHNFAVYMVEMVLHSRLDKRQCLLIIILELKMTQSNASYSLKHFELGLRYLRKWESYYIPPVIKYSNSMFFSVIPVFICHLRGF